MKVSSPKVVTELLKKYGLAPSKRFSQNFLIDENILKRIADSVSGDNILEIGPGLGALTQLLCAKAKRVLCYEIDGGMCEALKETLLDFDNVIVKNEDAMKADIATDARLYFDAHFCVAANLPYSITTPLIMRFLEEDMGVTSMVLMMQTEVAERICAPTGEDRSAMTLAVEYYSDARILFKVSQNCFLPCPSVSSSVVRFDIKNAGDEHKEEFFKLTKALFAMKRKTAENNFSAAFHVDKQIARSFFEVLNLNPSFRAQQFSVDDFHVMSKNLKNFLNNFIK